MGNKPLAALVVGLCVVMLYACQGEDAIRQAQFYTNGQKLYVQKCQNCHSANGQGLGELYPPLSDAAFMKRNKDRLACIVKFGLEEPIEVNGKLYDAPMPENRDLTEQDIAYILTYIGNSFGNEMGWIKTEEVSSDLKNCP